MKNIFLITLLFAAHLVFSQSSTSSAGDWSNGGNWTGGTPDDSDNATVNHDMTIDQGLTIDGTAIWTINNPTDDNGDEYDLTVKSEADLQVNADLSISGSFKISNEANLSVNSCATLTVGDMEIENSTTIFIGACSKLIVNGNLLLKNDIAIVSNGEICVNGDVTAENNASLGGSGSLTATGSIEIKDDAVIEFTSPLPIELLSFDANLNTTNNTVAINWSTASEINSDYYIIQRSADGIEWENIITTKAAGNSTDKIDYFETDRKPLQGVSYYRLFQMDFDGKFEIYSPVAINNTAINSSDELTAFPNPNSTNHLTVYIPNHSERILDVKIFSVLGVMIYSGTVQVSDTGLIYIDFPIKPNSGIYLLQVGDFVEKIIWQ